MNEQNQLLNEEQEKLSDEDMDKVTQAIEKVLVPKRTGVLEAIIRRIKVKWENLRGNWRDLIKRDGTVNIRRSSRENRSTRKSVRLKLRPQRQYLPRREG
ncbi:hypothetical protein TNCV_3308811 [Trichonephila clavipes]|nr:hypothetical protein TNCV_3308811 [Trichonephila clavipes]